jgi:hypothetical protein
MQLEMTMSVMDKPSSQYQQMIQMILFSGQSGKRLQFSSSAPFILFSAMVP